MNSVIAPGRTVGTQPAQALPRRGGRFRRRVRNSWQLWILVLPAVVFFFVFKYVPMYGVQIAFKDFIASKGIWGSEWVGLEHFQRFFSSFYFWRLLRNTLGLSLYQLLLFPLPIILALSLNEVKNRFFKRFAQTLTYAPHFVSVVVVVGMMVAFLDPRIGIANHFLGLIGIDSIPFMQEAGWFRHLFVWSGVWQSLGWGTIIYLAALAGVNPELHQAAEVDGATRLQRIRHVNIPAILPTVVILFILDFGSFMSVGFEKVLLMSNSLNAETSDIIQTFVYKSGLLQGQYSYAAAVGLFDSVINILMIVGVNHLARRISDTSLW
ncbi:MULTISPECIES: ABC transporter permease [Brachybacterium]|uniref:Sugar ABC transporter permease n=1 Tax=Brachybacterium alimentarium TaxID=47845 RepID=A0A2A3YJ45_9MICO|nr:MULTISPECIES: ABC transporter permease subunit [Brachybacterium]PCC33673.1 sugar ABC transporter permease [Brachybacterium alimentarium]PCC39324.1 sugar ABC transporter permease [Brachybacterium alimentarium]RCS66271.1 sugar ABC transporter permease [Brachybacterium sp. JB7]RCS69571.1 sugar ABC transporter permease [Brachybacterium alimentarium]RCS75120.1 sugar ABC transporter permease [Brachybacterium alimentarium]